MIAKNTNMYNTGCMACLNTEGQKKVVDTYFDNGHVVVMFRCQACGGITKNTYELHLGSYISGPRKKVYQEKGK